MTRRLVAPDPPMFVVDASNFDELPLELQRALGEFFSEKEREKARAEARSGREYQNEQAKALLSFDGWVEVDCRACVAAIKDEEAHDKVWPYLEPKPLLRVDERKEREELELWESRASDDPLDFDAFGEPSDEELAESDAERAVLEAAYAEELARHDEVLNRVPTIHQFYDDLYCAPVLSGGEFLDDAGCDLSLQPDTAILVNHRDRKHPYQLYRDYLEFISAVERETSFIYMGSFWVPPTGYLTSRKNAMTTLNGFCVDIDRAEDGKGGHFPADWVMRTLIEFLQQHPEVMPNYLMLSGTGIQLWYVFGRSIPLLSARGRNGRKPSPRRAKYDSLLKKLYSFFRDGLPQNRFKVDTACAAINHAFRAPDSPTKLHYQTRLFVLGGRRRGLIDPLVLSDFLGGDLKPYDLEDWDQEKYERIRNEAASRRDDWLLRPATEKQKAWLEKLAKMGCVADSEPAIDDMTKAQADSAIKRAETVFTAHAHYIETGGYIDTANGHRVRLRPRDKHLYENVLERIERETPTGSRYWSLFALAGYGYNCNIPRHVVFDDMKRLMESDWGREASKDGKPVNMDDIRSAMKGYNPLGVLRPRATAEEYLSWKFGPPQRRNGRTRKQHLWGRWYDGDGREVLNKAKAGRDFAIKNPDGRPLAKKRREESVEKLADYLRSNPSASKRAACDDLHMSRTTVTKYWGDACSLAGVQDTRSGNHRPF